MSRVALAILLAVYAAGGYALDARKNGDVRRIADPDKAVQQAISRINKRYQGRVLSATPVDGGRRIRVKFLSEDGVVRILFVDPSE